MKTRYKTDGKSEVTCGKFIVARSYVGNDGYEVRIRQGLNREATMEKIKVDCPQFLTANNIPANYSPKLFS